MVKRLLFFLIIVALCSSSCFCFASCNDHAYRECVGNKIYWYDSCSKRESLYKDCSNDGLFCQYGKCVSSLESYDYSLGLLIQHAQLGCFNKSIYWYNSAGSINDLYKNCSDSNSCTIDSCLDSQCFNALKCDETTCKSESSDYKKYCGQETEIQEDSTKNEENTVAEKNILSATFFAKNNEADLQWNKLIEIGNNSTIYFMIVVSNDSSFQIDNVVVSANIPEEITYLGNLKIGDVTFAGDIVSGISIGSIQPLSKRTITFEGKTQNFENQKEKEAIAVVNFNDSSVSDSIDVSFNNTSVQADAAALSTSSTSGGIWSFLKHWFMWIIAGIVLVALFVAIFKRLSSNV